MFGAGGVLPRYIRVPPVHPPTHCRLNDLILQYSVCLVQAVILPRYIRVPPVHPPTHRCLHDLLLHYTVVYVWCRRWFYHGISVFLQSILLLIVAYMTFFYVLDNFQARNTLIISLVNVQIEN